MNQDQPAQDVALVTGAGRGIGRAIARDLAAAGFAVAVAARTEREIAAVAEEIRAAGGTARAVSIDITDEQSVAAALAATVETLGPPRVVVNNAGAHIVGPFEEIAAEEWISIFAINVLGAVNVTKAALPHLRAQGGGRVINIASTAGKMGSMFQSPYNASKHALVGVTRCLALELAPDNILVNAVCPGFTETQFTADALEHFAGASGQSVEQFRSMLAAKVPLKRFLLPEEVAGLVTLLAGPGGSAMTGQAITVAGGMLQD